MELHFYHVTAFADQPFKGNPAAVIILDEWLEESVMQSIAAEFNLSETVFCVQHRDHTHPPTYGIRWFTPEVEIPLCGHATIAASHVLYEHLKAFTQGVAFSSASGQLGCTKANGLYTLDFPANVPTPVDTPAELEAILGCAVRHCLAIANKLLVIVDNEKQLAQIRPDFNRMQTLEAQGVIVSALADSVDLDFVSRFFAPRAGINEDPVTGSAHAVLVPYYAQALQKNVLRARQISKRGGDLELEYAGDRVFIGGKAHTVMQGQLYV